MRSLGRTLLLTLLVLPLFCFEAPALAGPFMLNLDVPAGQWKAARLSDLTKGAVLALQVESSGDILVAVLDSKSYRGKPDTERPLFAGQVEKRLSFTISVQDPGDHYVVLDNRRGKEKREVRITIQTAKQGKAQRQSAGSTLQDFERRLRRLFIFDPFPIALKKCGSAKALLESGGVVFCEEYLQRLNQALQDQAKTSDLFTFSLYHEVARVLLSKWKDPAAARVEKADELAAVLMVMLNQKDRATRVSRHVLKDPSSLQPLMETLGDERHPLSAERAGRILKWTADIETVRKWQKTLVPHMQTALLKGLKQKPVPWADIPLVEEELARRSKTPV